MSSSEGLDKVPKKLIPYIAKTYSSIEEAIIGIEDSLEAHFTRPEKKYLSSFLTDTTKLRFQLVSRKTLLVMKASEWINLPSSGFSSTRYDWMFLPNHGRGWEVYFRFIGDDLEDSSRNRIFLRTRCWICGDGETEREISMHGPPPPEIRLCRSFYCLEIYKRIAERIEHRLICKSK